MWDSYLREISEFGLVVKHVEKRVGGSGDRVEVAGAHQGRHHLSVPQSLHRLVPDVDRVLHRPLPVCVLVHHRRKDLVLVIPVEFAIRRKQDMLVWGLLTQFYKGNLQISPGVGMGNLLGMDFLDCCKVFYSWHLQIMKNGVSKSSLIVLPKAISLKIYDTTKNSHIVYVLQSFCLNIQNLVRLCNQIKFKTCFI